MSLNTVGNGVETGPRGHVGPALMGRWELGSGSRKSQDERARGGVELGSGRALEVGRSVLRRKQHPAETHETVPRGRASWPIADTRGPDDAETDSGAGVAHHLFLQTRETSSKRTYLELPGSPVSACSGTTRHLGRHQKRGAMYRTARVTS